MEGVGSPPPAPQSVFESEGRRLSSAFWESHAFYGASNEYLVAFRANVSNIYEFPVLDSATATQEGVTSRAC